jgi:prephenate dehydratase
MRALIIYHQHYELGSKRQNHVTQVSDLKGTRVVSPPTNKALGDYYFSIDIEGHVDDARVAEALMGLHRVCLDVRFLGSYPRHDGRAPVLRDGVTDADFAEASEWLRKLKGDS